jgi:membrane fusion protein (multidrug efflux system)
MKHFRPYKIILAAVIVLIAGAIFWRSFKNSGKSDQIEESIHPVALVKTLPIKKETIIERIITYGITIPAPGALQTVSVPYESRIMKVMVTDGQEISKGSVLMIIEPSPDTRLQLEQAENRYESTRLSLEHFERLLSLKLATNDQIVQEKQAYRQAKLNLESLKKRGIKDKSTIKSGVSGLVTKIHVQEGEIVPTGGTLAEIVVDNHLEVRLGIESENINLVRAGQQVSLSPVNVESLMGLSGKIRKVSGSINPETRLVDVFVSVSENDINTNKLLLGEFIRGTIKISSSEGLTVPRSAVLPEDEKYKIFTVKKGRSVKHYVKIGLENDNDVEIIGSDLKQGEPVVILGNYELQDGMNVRVEASN